MSEKENCPFQADPQDSDSASVKKMRECSDCEHFEYSGGMGMCTYNEGGEK